MKNVSIKGIEITFSVKVAELSIDGISDTNEALIRQEIAGIISSIKRLQESINNLNPKTQ